MHDDGVICARPGCGHLYGEHFLGGLCQVWSGNPATVCRQECPCQHFLWVSPTGPAVGSYREPPASGQR